MELVDILKSQLGVQEEQAKGGAGLLFQLAQEKLQDDQFSQISQYVPGMAELLGAAPQAGGMASALGGHDDGTLSGGAVWVTVTGEGEGVPDGMKVDLADRIFCNGPGGVHVFGPDAGHLGVIATPEKSTNFCFGGPDLSTLFITASTRVYAIDTLTRGAPMIHR